MNVHAKRTVLISGASIAGTASAYWLRRNGFDVTVVERASAPRAGGYPIDVRGTAVEVVRRMGLLPELQAAHIDTKRVTFLDADGSTVATLDPRIVGGGADGDLELGRGDLSGALYATVRDEVEFLFDDSVAALAEHDHGIDVTFDSGTCRTFDLVLGADGLHSRTRRLIFGPEQRFHHYLGYCFAGFSMPNTFGLADEVVLWSTPGRAAALYAVGNSGKLHALLNFARAEPPLQSPGVQRNLVAAAFADAGWEVPAMVGAMRDADDLFFDVVGQIRMPGWSRGRTALVGDAAYAPSFLTGQGSSLALVGAYILADALAEYPDHTAAFAAYERNLREFVTANQALVGTGSAALFPSTAQALEQRNNRLRELGSTPRVTERPAHSALTLPHRP
ncbi:putative monooxygenase [Nocardia nova SH22a]|uniref:Putative monooxygenase n=1 Tax=Nocardia nova SH22a TaxID=1415166 RepID=W5TRA8_9NOCA|nr:FAD-dependent monooxygenase [Nocardia nova]AHH21458.1 putative monooxygenase [Nocardia nova SH22a]